MPNQEIDALRPSSSDAQKKAAISACIAQHIRAGKEKDQAAAMCFDMAKRKTNGE